jgi:pimeloyl-ACP methyl ester carboxylesterase
LPPRLLLLSLSSPVRSVVCAVVRYLGEEGDEAPVAAAVANSPGYDIGVCLTRVGYLYDSAFYIGVLKEHWLGGENGEMLRAAAPDVCRRMAAAANMHEFVVAAAPFAAPTAKGQRTLPADAGTVANAYAAFLGRSNPMGTAHRIQVPTLVLNADDDPICASANLDENLPLLSAAGACPRTVVLRFASGGHCCFARGLRARRWGDELAARFLAAAAAAKPPPSQDASSQ